MLPESLGFTDVLVVVLMGALGMGGCEDAAGAREARQDTVQIIRAVVAWADSSDLRPAGAPLVVLDRPISHRPPASDQFARGGSTRVDPVVVPLHAAIEDAEGLTDVLVCSHDRGPRADQLWDTRPPWLVANLSLPLVEGNAAVMSVDLLPVEGRYSGGAGFLLRLVKSGRRWSVASAQHRSEID